MYSERFDGWLAVDANINIVYRGSVPTRVACVRMMVTSDES